MNSNWSSSINDIGLARDRAKEYRRLFDEVGPARFEVAINRAIREHSSGFFPTLGEFMPYVPGPGGERRTCSRCCNTPKGLVFGWCTTPEGTRYRALKACTHDPFEAEEIQ